MRCGTAPRGDLRRNRCNCGKDDRARVARHDDDAEPALANEVGQYIVEHVPLSTSSASDCRGLVICRSYQHFRRCRRQFEAGERAGQGLVSGDSGEAASEERPVALEVHVAHSAGDAAARFRDALRDLYKASGSPTLAAIVQHAAKLDPPVWLNDSTISDWLKGKTVPDRAIALEATVRFLLDRTTGYDRFRSPEAWEALRLAARAERDKRRGRSSKRAVTRTAQRDGQASSPSIVHRPPAYLATARELAERTPELADRHSELNEFRRFATSGEGFRWLVGVPWAGKTALVAKFFTSPPADVDMVVYFLQGRSGDADALHFISAAVAQLAWLLNEDAPLEPDRHVLAALWQRAAQRADRLGRHLLLMVDGLDEDLRPPGQPSVAAVLPACVADKTHVLITSRVNPPLPDDVDPGHQLHRTRPIHLEQSPEARDIERAARHELSRLLTGRSAADPLIAQQVLGILAAAAGALSVDDLAEITGRSTFDILQFVDQYPGRVIEPIGDPPRYRFAHQTLLDQTRDHFFAGHRLTTCHDALDSWAQRWADRDWPIYDSPEYLLRDYPRVLVARKAKKASGLVSQPGWLEAASCRLGVDEFVLTVARFPHDEPTLAQVRRMLGAEAHHIRSPHLLDQPGYVARQLCLAALHTGADGDTVRRWQRRVLDHSAPQLVVTATNSIAEPTLMSVLGRHDSAIDTIALSPDGRWVASSNPDGSMQIFDVEGKCPPRELGETGTMFFLAFTADGRSVISFLGGGEIEEWDAQGQRPPRELGRHKRHGAGGAAMSPDRRWVITGGGDGRYQVWDLAGRCPPREFGSYNGNFVDLAFTPDGRRVVISGSDGGVRVHDFTGGRKARLIGRHDSWISTVEVSPDGRWVALGADRVVKIWDLTGREPERHLNGYDALVTALAFTPDGMSLIAGDFRGVIRVYDMPEALSVRELGHHPNGVSAMVVSRDGLRIITGGGDGALREWDLSLTGPGPAEVPHASRISAHNAIAFSPDLQTLASGSLDGAVSAITIESDQRERELGRHAASVWAVACSPDARQVASGDSHGNIRLWDIATRELPRELGHHGGGVRALAYSPDGRSLISTGRNVLKWDLSGRPQPHLLYEADRVDAAAFSPDGRWVIGGSDDGTVCAWTAVGRRQKRILGTFGDDLRAVAVSPDRRCVIAAGGYEDEQIQIYDFTGRQSQRGICLDSMVQALSVSPDSQ